MMTLSRAKTRWRMSDVATDILTTYSMMTARGSTRYVENMATTVRPLRTKQDANTLTFEP